MLSIRTVRMSWYWFSIRKKVVELPVTIAVAMVVPITAEVTPCAIGTKGGSTHSWRL